MSTPFLAEIKLVSFNYPPKGWAFCNGQILPINQNQALFSLLGTTYGGDGRVNFALPNLRGRTPLHMGNGFTLGEHGGASSHTLAQNEMPTHIHFVQGSNDNAAGNTATGNVYAKAAIPLYSSSAAPAVALNAGAVTSVGGSQPHNNMQPYIVVNFVIALQGIFPSQN